MVKSRNRQELQTIGIDGARKKPEKGYLAWGKIYPIQKTAISVVMWTLKVFFLSQIQIQSHEMSYKIDNRSLDKMKGIRGKCREIIGFFFGNMLESSLDLH